MNCPWKCMSCLRVAVFHDGCRNLWGLCFFFVFLFFFLYIRFTLFQTINLQSPGTLIYLNVPGIPVRKPLQNRHIDSWRTTGCVSLGVCNMAPINTLVFVVLKISFSCKSLCLQIIAEVSKILTYVQRDIVFIYFQFTSKVLSQTVNVFV